MTTMTGYNPGTFCWVDLATMDAAGAKQFYQTLFGWEAVDIPIGEDAFYTLLKQDGKKVCALYKMSSEMMEQGVPPHWQSYVSVDNADASTARAQELGGAVVMEPFDVMGDGRMAVIMDPAGASFSVWQPKESFGAELVNEPNSCCWNELITSDVTACSAFYSGLFGWACDKMETQFGDYSMFRNGDRQSAGMMAIQEAWGAAPPNWGVYFAVSDCDATLEQAESSGGDIVSDPMDLKVGRCAGLVDSHGALFSVIRLADPKGGQQ